MEVKIETTPTAMTNIETASNARSAIAVTLHSSASACDGMIAINGSPLLMLISRRVVKMVPLRFRPR